MIIDRDRVEKEFKKYTDKYDISDEKIKLKVDHTYRVAAICERIAATLGLCDEDINLVWLIGMLHDIGRFEQLKNFGTFSDADSIDHAHYGVELLFDEGLIERFVDDENKYECEADSSSVIKTKNREEAGSKLSELDILKTAIWNHSAYRIEEVLSDRVLMFCNIIRDADKIDILKVNYEVTLEVIYDVTTDQLKKSSVTDEVMKAFMEHHAVLRKLKKTPIDHLVGHAALVFELVYDESFKIVKEQGYLDKMLSFKSDNTETVRQFQALKDNMAKFMREHQ